MRFQIGLMEIKPVWISYGVDFLPDVSRMTIDKPLQVRSQIPTKTKKLGLKPVFS